MIILDECVSPGTPSEFVAAAVVLDLPSLKNKSIPIILCGWKKNIFTRSCSERTSGNR